MADTQSQATHKPGVFKQSNKSHKTGRHRSKGQIFKEAGGRVNAKVLSKQLKKTLQKKDRVNRIQQIRKQKRDEVLTKKRSRGAQGSPPFLVVVAALCEGLDCEAAVKTIVECDSEITSEVNDLGTCHINVPRFKQRFSFVAPEYGNLYALLDAVKVADSVLFIASPEFGIDRYGEHCLSCLTSQGVPASVMVLQGLSTIPVKKQGEIKKNIQKRQKNRFPDLRLHGIDSPQDGLLVLRTIGTQRHSDLTYRERRPHLMAENVSFELDNEHSSTGTLKVTGYLRGRPLSANDLVHLPGWDTYQLIQIDAANDPYTGRDKRNGKDCEMEDASTRILEVADARRQASLQAEVELDPMEGEQTWPTEEELAEAEAEFKQKTVKKTKKVPKGTSEYQASWIIASDGEEDEDDEEDSDDEDDEVAMDDDEDEDSLSAEDVGMDGNHGDGRRVTFNMPQGHEDDDDEETESMALEGDDSRYDKTIDPDEEADMFEKLKAARLNQMYPDEVDTPRDVPAKERFARYRGLQSFRTSPWDPKENLPRDYARCFQFENFRRSKKRALDKREEATTGAQVGWYITIHLKDVPKEFMESYRPGHPIILFGLLEHEQKTSVVHFLLKRTHGNERPIKSKERLIFHVGFRRFSACPIFSQHTNASKHKFERYLQDLTIATVYAPITFSPVPVLVFSDRGFGRHELIANGSVLSVNPDRIVAKRIILSGHPFKINKKSAVVRYMFFSREDILWFKPVELRTKWGRRGHIKEPLGTHGHMKVVMDGQLKSQDTVLMNLYKRVYPPWSYEPRVHTPDSVLTADGDNNTAMMDAMFE